MKMMSTKYNNKVVGIFTKDIPYVCSEKILFSADTFTKCKFANIGGRIRIVPEHGNIIKGIPVFTDETGDYVFITDTTWYYQDIRELFPDPGYEIAGASLIESIENKIKLYRDNGNRIQWNSHADDPTGGYEPTTVYYEKAKVIYFSSAEEMKGGYNHA